MRDKRLTLTLLLQQDLQEAVTSGGGSHNKIRERERHAMLPTTPLNS